MKLSPYASSPLLALLALASPLLAASTLQESAPNATRKAQIAPKSPLAACKLMAGAWTGSGKVTPTGNPEESMTFELQLDSVWVAGGEGLLEQVHGKLSNGDEVNLIHLYAYDRSAAEMIVTGIGPSGGFSTASSCRHVGGGKLQTVWTGVDMGQDFSELMTWTIEEDSLSMRVHRSFGGADPFLFAEARLTRAKAEPRTVEAAQKRDVALSPALKSIQPMVGDYNVMGRFHGLGEMPAFAFTGTEFNHSVVGGSAILSRMEFVSKEVPMTFSAVALTGWDSKRKAFRRASVSTMDGGAVSTVGIRDGGFYSLNTSVQDGGPYAETVMIDVKDGHLSSMRLDGFMNGAARRIADVQFKVAK